MFTCVSSSSSAVRTSVCFLVPLRTLLWEDLESVSEEDECIRDTDLGLLALIFPEALVGTEIADLTTTRGLNVGLTSGFSLKLSDKVPFRSLTFRCSTLLSTVALRLLFGISLSLSRFTLYTISPTFGVLSW